jgi:Domain of unknown function (DUF4082)/Bacterial Ig domain/Fibronectin type III domain
MFPVCVNLFRFLLFCLVLLCWGIPRIARASIASENALTGNLPSEWDVSGIGDPSIQGFATDFSVNRGTTVQFKINTNAAAYRVDIYRLGYYGGRGARKVATINPSASLPQTQPTFVSDPVTGLADCGNWAVSASWAVPSNATSGVYIARPVRTDNNGASHMIFVVRDDAGNSDFLFQTSDTTWHAYNRYGGPNLYRYGGIPPFRAYKVSYNRPFSNRGGTQFHEKDSYLFSAEYPMIRWLEANGYNVSYASGVDTDRRGSAALLTHKVFLSVGHDEYWSGQQRTNVEAARAGGVHLGFFSGNEIFWKTRWENSIAGASTAYRTLVCYKETIANAKIDPSAGWTGTWRDPRFSPPSDGGRPENALLGQFFTVNAHRDDPILVSSSEGKMRFWRNTGINTLAEGQSAQLPAGVLGFEWDEVRDNGFLPPGLQRLSTTTIAVNAYVQDYGSTYAPGVATHNLTLYRHSSGALVFGAGTIQWSWGLDATHDFAGPAADVRMQQATVNLFADMGAQPTTLQAGLVAATQSTDTIAPTSVILMPPGQTVLAGSTVTILGTATDAGGGRPAGVEFSTDGGSTWHLANGAANWTATWTTSAPGVFTIRSRAVDDSGRIENPGPGISMTVVMNPVGFSLWPLTATPAILNHLNESPSAELGVRFRSDRAGWIKALRFYKGANNTGLHVGRLWANNGTLLATATFANETAAGWQEVQLPTPISIAADTLYVASYHLDSGYFSKDASYFAGKGQDRAPLHAPANGVAGPNGVYREGASAFPTNTVSSNYWVDVVFADDLTTNTPPAPTGLAASAVSGIQINLAWLDSASNETGFKIERKTGAAGTYVQIATVAANVTTYPNTGLTAGTSYFYRVCATNVLGDSAYSPEASASPFSAAWRAAASHAAASGVLSLSIDKPVGTLPGDMMVASIAVRASSPTITAPSGWTLVRQTDNTNPTANSLATYYRVEDSPGPTSYSWSFSASAGSVGGIQSFSGIDTANPVDREEGHNTASSLDHAAPTVTTQFTYDMLVTAHAFSSSATFTPPSGMTEAFDVASDAIPTTNGESMEGNYQLQSAAGATGTRTAVASNNAGRGNAHMLALKASTTTTNTAPVANPQSVSVSTDGTLVINLTGTDADGNSLIFAAGNVSHGTLSVAGAVATYTPSANYNGPDSFSFTVNDGTAVSGPATVSITVSPANDFIDWLAEHGLVVDETDSDGDSIANAVEYVIGGNPATGMNVNLLPTIALLTSLPGGNPQDPDYARFTYRRTDRAKNNLAVTLKVEWGTVLVGPWTNAGTTANTLIDVIDDGFEAGVDRVDVYLPCSLAVAGKLFARLEVAIATP